MEIFSHAYLEISFFGFFETAQVVVGSAYVDVSSDVVVLYPAKYRVRHKF